MPLSKFTVLVLRVVNTSHNIMSTRHKGPEQNISTPFALSWILQKSNVTSQPIHEIYMQIIRGLLVQQRKCHIPI